MTVLVGQEVVVRGTVIASLVKESNRPKWELSEDPFIAQEPETREINLRL